MRARRAPLSVSPRGGAGAGSRVRLAAVLVLLVAVLTSSAVRAADITAADAAFDAGDLPRALSLYEEVLATDPGNVRALVRSAKLLSWDRKFDEAIRRYDRALASDPANHEAQLERAKVLSWSRRYPEAEDAFRELLARTEGDRDARLGLARTLSWSGRQSQARAEYEKLLAVDPSDAEALVGVGQTYAWSGNARKAYPAYRKALEAQPGMKDAEQGLAYLDLASGDPAGARARADRLAAAHPSDSEVKDLGRATREATVSWVLFSHDRLDDSDGNLLRITRVEGGLSLPAGLDLRLGLARYDMSNGPLDGRIDSVFGALGARVGPRQRLEARIGLDRSHESSGSTRDDGTWGLVYSWGLGGDWSGTVSAQRDTLRYSVAILDRAIVVDAYAASVQGPLSERWRIGATAGTWDLSDGNARRSAEPGVWYRWPLRRVTVETGYVLRWFAFDETVDHGYFDPTRYLANALQARARATFLSSGRAYWDVTAEAAIQSYTQGPTEVSNDGVYSVNALAGFPLPHGLTVEANGAWSDYPLAGPGGFRFWQLGAHLRWRIGG